MEAISQAKGLCIDTNPKRVKQNIGAKWTQQILPPSWRTVLRRAAGAKMKPIEPMGPIGPLGPMEPMRPLEPMEPADGAAGSDGAVGADEPDGAMEPMSPMEPMGR